MFCSFNSGLALTKLLKAQVAASSRSLLLFPEPLLTVRSHPPGEGCLTQGGGHTFYLASEAWQVASVA